MATFQIFSGPFDMRTGFNFEGQGSYVDTVATSTTFSDRQSYSSVWTYGSGLTYDAEGAFTGGTVTRVEHKINATEQVLYRFDHAGYSAAKIETFYDPVSDSLDLQALLVDLFKGADSVVGSASADYLKGFGGNDTLNGGAGSDTMEGGTGNDLYYVGQSGDRIVETSTGGTDTVYAAVSHTLGTYVENARITGSGSVNVTGNALGNVIYAGAGNNVVNGGSGTDTLSYAYATAGVKVSLATTAAQATGGSGTDTVGAVERLAGSKYNDTLTGNSSANVLSGGVGNDVLLGGGGNDSLAGGAGLDTFRFASALGATTNVDAVTDFVAADDRFLLSSSVFAQAGPAGTLTAGAFRIGSNAADSTDRIVYDQSTGKLYYDADGSGAGAKVLFATVVPNTVLTNADFVIG